jgi:hypothetical protein
MLRIGMQNACSDKIREVTLDYQVCATAAVTSHGVVVCAACAQLSAGHELRFEIFPALRKRICLMQHEIKSLGVRQAGKVDGENEPNESNVIPPIPLRRRQAVSAILLVYPLSITCS